MLIWFIIPYERRVMEMSINDVASTLQKLRTSKGDNWIKQ